MTSNFERVVKTQTLNIDLSKNDDATVSLGTLCTDVFTIVIKMSEEQDVGTPEALRKLLKHHIDLCEQNCRAMKVDSTIVDSIKYALVALVDESVLGIEGPCKNFWLGNPLQLEYYGDTVAGEKFYGDLNMLLRNPEETCEALEVFYMCLSLGFHGKYLENSEEREKIISNLAKVLIRTRRQSKPRRSEPKAAPAKKRMNYSIPGWAYAIAAVVAIAIGWGLAHMSTDAASTKTIRAVNATFMAPESADK
ncbi:MAG: hypothetical protein GF344_17550 [Chitinivibrionales bacterium]|nr:hypothetical protein [Chitinivibrionales bacterium]MBD3358472.1 hypothetical protein [Chitinivibrionales bacterium]